MTAISIAAFLAFLGAFNVSPATIKTVSDILYASQATSTLQVATSTPTTVLLTPVDTSTTTPSFGATVQPIITQPVNPPAPMPESKAGIVVTVEAPRADYPNSRTLYIQVLDDKGKPVERAPIHISGPNISEDRTTNALYAEGWGNHGSFDFPKGTSTVTITSGELTKQVTVEVQ